MNPKLTAVLTATLAMLLGCASPAGAPAAAPAGPLPEGLRLEQYPVEPVHAAASGVLRPAVDPAVINAERALLGTADHPRAAALLEDMNRRFPAYDFGLTLRGWLEDVDGGNEQEFLRRVDPLRKPIWKRFFVQPDGKPVAVDTLAPYFAESVRRACADPGMAAILPTPTCVGLPTLPVPADFDVWEQLSLTSHQGFRLASWSPHGRRLSATDLLVELEIQPGMTVANLRAGDGWFALPMARLVGPTGKVVAEDASASLLDFVQFSAAQNGYSNLTTVRGAALDARLPAGAFDVVLACETMSAFYTNAQAQDPAWVEAHVLPFLRSVVAALKPEGRAIFMEPLPSAERPGILDPKYVVRDLERIGLVEFDELDEYRPGQAVMVFERAAAATQEAPAPKASPKPALPVAAPVAR